MRIGIIVHSKTGNTLSVAELLRKRLEKNGHSVQIGKVTVKGEVKHGDKNIEFTNRPKVSGYDALVFGSLVEAFSLSPVMKAYLKELPSLEGKRTACFVTKALPFGWTGGTRALSQMKKICRSKGASISGYGYISWNPRYREKQTGDLLDRFEKLL